MKLGLGTRLRAARVSQGLALSELALRIGISRAYLYQIEVGRVKRPSSEVLAALALHYSIPHEELAMMAGAVKQGRNLHTAPVQNLESTE